MGMQLSLATAVNIKLESSFEDILGYAEHAMTVEERRARWARWLRIARKRERSRHAAVLWTSPSEDCRGCRHLRGRAWCRQMELPACVNPVLSFRAGMVGMACMGLGWEDRG